jgi:predicted enzyme related to lactoylglutathione lyase
MAAQMGMIHFHTSDPRRLAAFWSALLDVPVDEGATDELAMLDFAHDHAPYTWIFQRYDDLSDAPLRLSLDLTADDWRKEARRVPNLGGLVLGERAKDGQMWIELEDPDGNLLRMFPPRP